VIRFLRSAFVIARRDFSATVLSKTFIIFLLAPLFPLLMGGMFGTIGSRISSQTERPVLAVIGPRAEIDRLSAAREQLAAAIGDQAAIKIVGYPPRGNPADQEHELLDSRRPPVRAVLSGGLNHPHLTGALAGDPGMTGQVKLLIANASSAHGQDASDMAVTNVGASTGSLANDRAVTAQIGQALLFFLTLMLSTMVLSQLIEEKSNKVIEVIAAAIPIDAMFVGKLTAMLCASVLALLVWMGSGALLIQLVKHGGVATLPVPAVGWPAFLVLAVVYFGIKYRGLGAALLIIGAQASTAREVQTMSLPATFVQLLIFGLASKSIGDPNTFWGIAGAAFPLSSPLTMLGRAAQEPEIWPHLAALAWQAIWVAIILRVGSQLFRKTVLKSGPRRPWWKLGRA
jgi:ABC-2 type transport system permease protein